MAGDWRARAAPVTPPSAAGSGGWRSRAAPVQPATPAPVDPGTAIAATRGALSGATAGWNDEATGWLESTFPRLSLPPGDFFDPSIPTPAAPTYEQARDAQRKLQHDARDTQGAAYLGGEIAGTLAGAKGLGAASQGYRGAVGMGALSGLGGSEAEGAGGMALDTAMGAGMGAIGQKVGNAIAGKSAAVRDWVLRRAAAGKEKAAELAQSLAQRDVAKTVNSLRGEAGGAASRAANLISNVDEIDLPAEAPGRTIGALKESLAGQLAAMEKRVADARAQAIASGINPDDLGAGRMGEFLSKGSKLDKAQQAAKKLQAYEDAAAKLRQDLETLSVSPDGGQLLDPNEALRSSQAALRTDPRFEDLKANVLKNALDDFPQVADQATAARTAYHEALSSQADDVARRAEVLNSPGAARERVKELGLRYGLPMVGGYLGAEMGGPEGAAVGFAAGAGTRPGFQAIMRTAKSNPAVQTAAWSLLERTAKATPEKFGQFAGAVAAAAARGPDALKALDKVLRDTSPSWRAMRAAQEEETRQ